MSVDDTLARAAQLLQTGHALEARFTPDALAGALRCYEQALVALRSLPLSRADVRHQLAITTMNRGNVLQRQSSTTALAAAIQAYDEAIAFFRSLPLDAHPDIRNSLGAAWMNRGHALFVRGDSASCVEAVHAQREAIAVLRTLPLDENLSYRVNLAAAWMNQANALLAIDDNALAADAARESLALTTPLERREAALADVGLKARRALCEAIGRLLVSTSHREQVDALADEASDRVDDGLALAREWEARGQPHFRTIALRLFRFGAQLYQVHLPDFLSEFLLEHIDPERSAGAMTHTDELYEIAAESLDRAKHDLEAPGRFVLDTPETARLLDRLQSLREAQARIAALRARFLSSA